MVLTGGADPALFSPILLLQIFLLNGLILFAAAYFLKKSGFPAPVAFFFGRTVSGRYSGACCKNLAT